jgi:hypothetical protein
MKRRPNNEKRAAAFERAFAAKERMDTPAPPDALDYWQKRCIAAELLIDCDANCDEGGKGEACITCKAARNWQFLRASQQKASP